MVPWPQRFVLFLNAHLRPEEGWGTVLAVLSSIAILVAAIEEAGWVRRAPSMYGPAILAVVLGIVLALKMRRGWLAGLVMVVAGLVVGVLTAARAWPSPGLLAANIRWLWVYLFGSEQALPEVVLLGPWMLDRLSLFAGDLAAWGEGVAVTGQVRSAPLVVVLMTLFMVWAVAVWAGWAAFRYHRALLALMPAGVLLAINIFFSGSGLYWSPVYVALLVFLGIRLRQYNLQKVWNAKGIDYSREYRLELYLSGFFVALILAAVMFMIPSVRVRFVTNAFWNVFRAPYQALEASAETIFPDLDKLPRSLADTGLAGGGGLPRSHLLGGAPDLAERVVMYVSTSDYDPVASGIGANYRWRGVTFSDYNGSGWENENDLESETFSPGDVWLTETPLERRTLRQAVELTGDSSFWLYAVGEPIAADRAYTAYLRGEDDAVGLNVRGRDYTVISEMPNVSEAELRAAPALDSGAQTPYLALPDTVPERVYALAEELTADAETTYDKAKTIEAFLRTYPYTLDVPEPPANEDVADYFLFDLQKGYCDYYATAMVVMARSLGMPARLAVGYAAGEYDPRRNRYTVTEADAHSWPEIYFSQYGWIPFEPTASQPVYVRSPEVLDAVVDATETQLDLAAELADFRRWAWLSSGVWRWGMLLFAVLAVMLLARGVWRDWQLRRQADNPWQLVYLRLESWGNRFGVYPAPWYTPREYARRWQAWLSQNDQSLAGQAGEDIQLLSRSLEQRAYAPAGEQPSDASALSLWRRLRGTMWRLRLSRWRRRD